MSVLTDEQRAMVEQALQTNPALQASQAYMTGMDGYQEQVDQAENIEDVQFGIDEATMMADGAIGAGMAGQVINSLTPQIQKYHTQNWSIETSSS